MFADIAGFTAWSSTREPFQVFQLLERLYGALDKIAKNRRIFKARLGKECSERCELNRCHLTMHNYCILQQVETVGDCYVAVCGLPTPRKDHAIVMCRFARDCHIKMIELTRKLEVSLVPDTADLSFRIGLHSGPVTGGMSETVDRIPPPSTSHLTI